MIASELMKDIILNPNFKGLQTNDNMVVAIQTLEGKLAGEEINKDTDISKWLVAQAGIIGFSPSLNTDSTTTQYIRSGSNTTKTSQQRIFVITGDRYIGDDFQDFCLSHTMKYGTGEEVIYGVVQFNIITGKGEIGKFSIIVDNDGGGNAGENSAITINFEQAVMKPIEYQYKQSAPAPTLNSSKLINN